MKKLSKIQESGLRKIVRAVRHQMNEGIGSTFLIEFITLDGNKQAVEVYATTKFEAKRKFEREYEYDEIISIEEID